MFTEDTNQACATTKTAQAIQRLNCYEGEKVKDIINLLDFLSLNMLLLPSNHELTYDLNHIVVLEDKTPKIKSLLD